MLSTYMFVYGCCFFFFKQKTAYELRISDWSSDVCSSDLRDRSTAAFASERPTVHPRHLGRGSRLIDEDQPLRVEMGLGLEPSFTFRGYVFAVLLGRVRRLFLRVTP